MLEDVKSCVFARVDFFDKYYSVPPNMQAEVNSFIQEVTALGESCVNASDFEAKFVSTGLGDKFMSILPKCTPIAQKITTEQKQYSREVMKEIIKEDKNRIIEDATKDVLSSAQLALESELIERKNKQMIENGTIDEYTKASNAIDDIGRIGGFLKNIFGKKKD